MAKRDETGELVLRSDNGRGFPWKLWLYALVMTAAAGGAGYYGWQFYEKSKTASEAQAACETARADTSSKQLAAEKGLTECTTARNADVTKTKELDAQLAQLSKNLNASKEELTTLRQQRAEAEKRLKAIEDIQKQFAKMVETGQLKVTSRRGSLVLSLPSEVLFASGSADLSEKGQMSVHEIGFMLKEYKDRRYMVLGHTDDAPLKSSVFADNWQLSTARALNVTRMLVKAGMSAEDLVAAGVGEHDPLGKDRAKNRRIEIVLLPAINELPPLPASLEADAKDPKKEPKK
ncbi:MAG: OmpA family protein [Kofleriaceae bacterium]